MTKAPTGRGHSPSPLQPHLQVGAGRGSRLGWSAQRGTPRGVPATPGPAQLLQPGAARKNRVDARTDPWCSSTFPSPSAHPSPVQ